MRGLFLAVALTASDTAPHRTAFGQALVRLNRRPEACRVYDELSQGYPQMRDEILHQRLLEFELRALLDDEHADITEDHVIVLRNAGPKGGPGMPEWGMLPIPVKLVKQGKAIFVDVRPKESFAYGHIKGAVNIPEAELIGRLKEIPPGRMIVTYCA